MRATVVAYLVEVAYGPGLWRVGRGFGVYAFHLLFR